MGAFNVSSEVALSIASKLTQGARKRLLARVRSEVDDVTLLPWVFLPTSLTFVHVFATAPSLAIVERSIILELNQKLYSIGP